MPKPELSFTEKLALNTYKNQLKKQGIVGMYIYLTDADEIDFTPATEKSVLITEKEFNDLRLTINNLLNQ